ncbi:MAG: hypothetical protein FWC76_02425 [Defluviitaleaceae bacterium]|nr:hypothetical protein [Defluviitaleaceae bacterium]
MYDDQGNQNNQGNQNDQGNQGNQNDQGNQGNHERIVVCTTNTCQDIALAVPIEIRAHAYIGNILLKCKGHRIVKEADKPQGVARFEIVQDIFAQIPIDFVAEIEAKDQRVYFDVHECK